MNISLAFTFTFSNTIFLGAYELLLCLFFYVFKLKIQNFLDVYEHLLELYFYVCQLKIQFSSVFINISLAFTFTFSN
jgi:hypothetical protein